MVSMDRTKKIAIFLSIIWLIVIYLYQSANLHRDHASMFIGFGAFPLVVFWGFYWIIGPPLFTITKKLLLAALTIILSFVVLGFVLQCLTYLQVLEPGLSSSVDESVAFKNAIIQSALWAVFISIPIYIIYRIFWVK